MAQIKLHSILFEAFRSFENDTKISFPDSGLVLFSGNSGSGKSSVLLAISYALGFCPYPATELQSWLTEKPMNVALELSVGKIPLVVARGPKSGVCFGENETKGAVNVKSAIEKATKISTDLLAALTYRPQQTRGLFLSKTNSEMQEFLSILLGLDLFEQAIELTTNHISTLTNKVASSKEAVISTRQKAEELKLLEPLPLIDIEELRNVHKRETEELEILSSSASHINEELDEIVVARKKELASFHLSDRTEEERDLDKRINNTTQVLTACTKRREFAQETWNKEKRRVKARLSEIHSIEFPEATAELRHIKDCEKQLPSLEKEECPTCNQPWVTSNLALIRREIERKPIVEKNIWLLEQELKQLDLIEQPEIVDELVNAEAELVKQKIELESERSSFFSKKSLEFERTINRKYDVAVQAKNSEAKVANELVLAASGRVQQLKGRLDSAVVNNKAAEANNSRLEATLNKAQSQLTEAEAVLKDHEASLALETDFLSLLKSFMGSIFDEVLNEIAYTTNDMLGEIPNVAHVTLNFRSESLTQKGTVKKAIVPVLVIGGEERPIRSALSGGMLAAVELAVDLAVRKVISARVGQIPNWLILDECFEGLGSSEKEACMQLLMKAGKDTLILVVDHASEFKEMFNQTIDVSSNNGRSSLSFNTN